jgi:hypothetical protein
MDVKNIVPSISGFVGRGDATRSYRYSPHLLYSPHLHYPMGVAYGLFPIVQDSQKIVLSGDGQIVFTTVDGVHILPVGDNRDIRP